MYVVCFVEWGDKWWPVWRPAFEYDAAGGLVRVGVGPCALSDLFRGLTGALPKPTVSTGVVDFGNRFGGKFDSTGTAAFESRFGTTGKRVHLVAMSALFMYPTGVQPEVVFGSGVEADVRPLVARLPPELLFEVARNVGATGSERATVLDVCGAVYEAVKRLSPGLKQKLDAEFARQETIGTWHSMGYTPPPETSGRAPAETFTPPPDTPGRAPAETFLPALAPSGAHSGASAAARILATIAERKRPTDVRDGLDAAALVSDRGLFWTSAVALGLLCDTELKTPVPTVAKWFEQLVEVASDGAAAEEYF
jgi:hypothetical protein